MKISVNKKIVKHLSLNKNVFPIAATHKVVGGTAYTNESIIWWCNPKRESDEVTCTCPTR